MAYICEFIPGDKAMQLGNEQLIRALPFGLNWAKIRVSVLCSINGTANIAGGKGLFAGFCTGTKAFHDPNCTDAIYSGCFGESVATYNTAGYIQGNGGNTSGPFQKVGSIVQGFAPGMTFAAQRVSAVPSLIRTLNMWDYTKNADGTMSYQGFYYTTHTDTLRAAYTLAVENPTTPAGMSQTNQSAACPLRSVKDWDTAFFAWNLSVPTVYVHAWTITRFA